MNQRQIAASGMVEQRIRDGRYSSLWELVTAYDHYMKHRFEMLAPKNMPLDDDSVDAYNCTLDLIKHVRKIAMSFNERKKIYFLQDLEIDEKRIGDMKVELYNRLSRNYSSKRTVGIGSD